MKRKSYKAALLLLPSIILALTFYYAGFVLSFSEQNIYETIRENRVTTTSIFANNIDGLVSGGFTWEEHQELYNSAIKLYIEMISVDDFVYTMITYSDFRCVERFEHLNTFDIFEDERNLDIIISATYESNVGFIEVWIDGEIQPLYFHAIPLEHTKYWVFVGVNRCEVIAGLDLSRLRLPIYMVWILVIVSVMDSVWQRILRIKQRRN